MRIRPGPDEENRKIELGKTEARQARPGYNIYVLVFGLIGVIVAFILAFFRVAKVQGAGTSSDVLRCRPKRPRRHGVQAFRRAAALRGAVTSRGAARRWAASLDSEYA